MKPHLLAFASVLLGTCLTLPATAQFATTIDGSGMSGMGSITGKSQLHGRHHPAPGDCTSKGRPRDCQANNDVCKGKLGAGRQQCRHPQRQNSDCKKAENLQRCQTREGISQACNGLDSPASDHCVQQKEKVSKCSL
jgi:hypothetical protein